jgi:drug/metabolite transporter (DMT)-like permease
MSIQRYGQPPSHALLRPGIVVPFVLCALIWGSTWYVIKDGLGAAPHSWSVAWRFVVAAVAMGALVLVRRESFRLDFEGMAFAAIFGLTQFCLNFNLLYRAETYLTSGLVAVLFALLMLPNAVFARIFFGQRVTWRFQAGTVVAISGIALLLLHEARVAPAGGEVGMGIALAVASIVAASLANVMHAAPAGRRLPLLPMLFWSLVWGALGDVAFALASAGPPVLPLDARYLGGVLFLGIMGSVVTYPLYIHLIRELGAGRAAYNGVVVPIVAMGLSTVLEGYRWSLLAGGGAVLALLGMVIALRARNPSR